MWRSVPTRYEGLRKCAKGSILGQYGSRRSKNDRYGREEMTRAESYLEGKLGRWRMIFDFELWIQRHQFWQLARSAPTYVASSFFSFPSSHLPIGCGYLTSQPHAYTSQLRRYTQTLLHTDQLTTFLCSYNDHGELHAYMTIPHTLSILSHYAYAYISLYDVFFFYGDLLLIILGSYLYFLAQHLGVLLGWIALVFLSFVLHGSIYSLRRLVSSINPILYLFAYWWTY